MGLECGWCHVRKRWSWEFEDFEKSQLKLDHWGESWVFGRWELGCVRWGRELRSWDWTVEDESWIWAVAICRVFRISTDRDLKHHKMHRALGWGQHSKSCVSLSLCRHGPKSEINKLVRTCLYLHMYMSSIQQYHRTQCYNININSRKKETM